MRVRVHRLQQLGEGLNTELVQVAINREPLTKEERLAYCTDIEETVQAAKAALVPVQAAAERVTQKAGTTAP